MNDRSIQSTPNLDQTMGSEEKVSDHHSVLQSHTEGLTRKGRWYFGGLASAGAACFTHPLDLLKVHLQTQQQAQMGLVGMGAHVVRSDGVLALYSGLSASLLRQLTYSLARFAIYETVKSHVTENGHKTMPFYQKVLVGGVAGFFGGIVGTPADLINVRMQNDVKLPVEQRRNYKHAVDGLVRIARDEGPVKLMSGVSMASSRAVFMTIGQLSFYDQFKQMLVASGYFADTIYTHFFASSMAAGVATFMTMPMDVMKTRMMNAKPGQYDTVLSCARDIVSAAGPKGFFKGLLPAFVRLGPHTVLTFMIFEQLRLNFGIKLKGD